MQQSICLRVQGEAKSEIVSRSLSALQRLVNVAQCSVVGDNDTTCRSH